MRQELISYEEYFWGLTKEDFKITTSLVKEFMRAYWRGLTLPKNEKTVEPEIELFIAQHYRETQFLIQFGIWRLQSIFESLITANFNIQIRGFRKKIEELKRNGYTILKEDELFKWTLLRNILSHSPPEITQPCPKNLIESDIDEFSQLLYEIYEDLEVQKSNIRQ